MTDERKDMIWPKVSGVVEVAKQMSKDGHDMIRNGTAMAEEGRRLVASASQLMRTMKGVPGAPVLDDIPTPPMVGHRVKGGFWRKNIVPMLSERGRMSVQEIADEMIASKSSYLSPNRDLVLQSIRASLNFLRKSGVVVNGPKNDRGVLTWEMAKKKKQ